MPFEVIVFFLCKMRPTRELQLVLMMGTIAVCVWWILHVVIWCACGTSETECVRELYLIDLITVVLIPTFTLVYVANELGLLVDLLVVSFGVLVCMSYHIHGTEHGWQKLPLTLATVPSLVIGAFRHYILLEGAQFVPS